MHTLNFNLGNHTTTCVRTAHPNMGNCLLLSHRVPSTHNTISFVFSSVCLSFRCVWGVNELNVHKFTLNILLHCIPHCIIIWVCGSFFLLLFFWHLYFVILSFSFVCTILTYNLIYIRLCLLLRTQYMRYMCFSACFEF